MEAVLAQGLRKRFGATTALDGVDLAVPAGSVVGLLGPNGAGKSTLVRILTTLSAPDGGSARIDGLDVVTRAAEVRTRIGLAGQHASVDEYLTGRANLVLFARLHGLGTRAARDRAAELLDRFDLAAVADRPVGTYSGGTRRRLDVVASLVTAPSVLFLDEPTTGLDPRSRNEIWATVRDLAAAGTTIVLTTQYLDEADHLADRVAVIDHGRVVADGTPAELKERLDSRLDVVVRDAGRLADAAALLAEVTGRSVQQEPDRQRVGAPTDRGSSALARLVPALDAAGIETADVTLRRATLDEVFLQLTGDRGEVAA
jgi:ABC-2 type transport system ATP-binding protein